MKQMKDLAYHIGLKVKIYPSDEQKRLHRSKRRG